MKALFPDHADIRDIGDVMDKQLRLISRARTCTCDAYEFPHRKFSGRCYAHRFEYAAATSHDWEKEYGKDVGIPHEGEL